MKKRVGIQATTLVILIIATITFMDYIAPEINQNIRIINITFIIIVSGFLIFIISSKFFPEQDRIKEKRKNIPVLIPVISGALAFLVMDIMEPRLGKLTTYPFFNASRNFDWRSPLSFLIFILFLVGLNLLLTDIYFSIKNWKK